MADSNKTVYAAIGANLTVATAKFVVAAFTGSSSMLAEGIHSLIDTINGDLGSQLDPESRSTPTRTRTWNTSLEARDDHPFHHRGHGRNG